MPLRSTVALALGLLAAAPSQVEPMRVVEVSPAARTVMDGNRQKFFVRFGEPVDHGASRLVILRQDGEFVRTLAPRLSAAPDTLYANAGGLAPGAYRLRWEAHSRRGGMPAEGTIDFQVR